MLFVSIHQSPLYPGTGPARDVGSGAGEGYTVNLPVPGGTGDAGYRSLVEHVVAPLIARLAPELVLVSAGFDAHRDDPLAVVPGHRGRLRGHDRVAAPARADAVGAPLGLVLEGGYSVEALGGSVCALVPVLRRGDPRAGGAAVHELASAALRRLAPYWPGLRRGSA